MRLVYSRRGVGESGAVDCVVIGSGFGGSVVALRLAEDDRSVLVLERGQPYPPGSFARTPHAMRTNFWEPSEDLYGLFDVWCFKNLDVVLASGLGGGSLIYANVMLRKEEDTFVTEDLSRGGYESWPVTRHELDRHYDRVWEIQQPQKYPRGVEPYEGTPKARAMRRAAVAMQERAEQPPLAVAFAPGPRLPAVPGQPIPDGQENLHHAPRSTCRLCGECDMGCNYGSKHTLDFTFLSKAKDEGAEIRTCCEVHTIIPLRDRHGVRCYEVRYHQHLAARGRHRGDLLDPSLQSQGAVRAKQVVLAAGAIGTPALLMRNRTTLRRLSPALGTRFSANGDCLAWVRNCRAPNGEPAYLDPSNGPVITTSVKVRGEDTSYLLQDAGAPAFADWLWQELELPRDVLRVGTRMARRALDRLRGEPDSHFSGMLARLLGDARSSAAMMPVLAMGRDVPNGRLALNGRQIELDWSSEPSSEYYEQVERSLRELAAALGGEILSDGLSLRKRSISVHPVGGCAMSEDPRRGVVDAWGEVHGHPGVFIADGSVMPGPVGVNPSFTIAALADRFSLRMTGQE